MPNRILIEYQYIYSLNIARNKCMLYFERNTFQIVFNKKKIVSGENGVLAFLNQLE